MTEISVEADIEPPEVTVKPRELSAGDDLLYGERLKSGGRAKRRLIKELFSRALGPGR
jgi:hypothetical protein